MGITQPGFILLVVPAYDGSMDWDDDPNNWPEPLSYRLLFLSDHDDTSYCIIDRQDWAWASKHKWRVKGSTHKSRGRKGGDKVYVVTSDYKSPAHSRKSIFLHKEVVFRAKGPPPNEKATIGDHISGDSLDNRRLNLKWATPQENRWNRNGLAYYGKLI